jgi:MFS family permease
VQNTKAISILLASHAISGVAQGISMIAIPWYFARILDMETTFGVAFSVITIATLFWSVYSGTLIDRYSRKKLFLWLNAIGMLILGGSAAIGFIQDGLAPAILIGVAAFTIFNYNLHFPNMFAFGQELISKEFYGRYNSIV